MNKAAAVKAATSIESLIGKYVTLTKNGTEYEALCPFHKEKSASFRVVPDKGFFHCFGCGAHGDAIDFVMDYHRVGFPEALAIMGGDNIDPIPSRPLKERAPAFDPYAAFAPAHPVPPDAPVPVIGKRLAGIVNPKRHDDPDKRVTSLKPVLVHPYRTASGELLGYVLRIDIGEGRKITPAIQWCRGPDGKHAWTMRYFDDPRPLYGLEALSSSPTAAVVVVEGEKAKDAAAKLLPRSVVVTWCGGTNAVHKTDWAPLRGRKVAIWPDADDPGRKAANAIAGILSDLECTVTIADVDDLSDGFDAADLPPDTNGVAWLKPRLRPYQASPAEPESPTLSIVPSAEPDDRDYSSPPPPPEDEDAPPLGPIPLGYDHGKFYYLSRADGQIHILTSGAHSPLGLMGMASRAHYWERTKFMGKDGVSWTAAADDFMQKCRDIGIFDPSRIRGRGCFHDAGATVLHLGDRLVIDGASCALTAYRSRYIYPASLPMEFPLMEPMPASRASEVRRLCDMLTLEQSYMSILLAGWIVIAPVCGALWWRPHIWISGPKGSGKSYVMNQIIPPLCGGIAYTIDGKSTEAGVRQSLSSDARPVIFDEAEATERDGARIQSIVDLARYASSEAGARIVKGSMNGVSNEYVIRSCFAFASINSGLHEAADESRTVSIRFRPNHSANGAEHFDEIKSLTAEVTDPQFVGGLLSRTLSLILIIRENARVFSRAIRERYGDQRQGDTIGTLIAGAYSLHSSSRLSLDQARAWIGDREWVRQAAEQTGAETDDYDRIIDHLLESTVKIGHQDIPIGEIIDVVNREPLHEWDRELRRHGIRLIDRKLYIATSHLRLDRIFHGTTWGKAWSKTLLQSPICVRHPSSVKFGTATKRAITLPIERCVTPSEGALS